MARSTKSYEERLLQLEKREQESLEKAKQYAAQKRELKTSERCGNKKTNPQALSDWRCGGISDWFCD